MPFQNGLKRCVFSKSFSEVFSLAIDYRILVIDYTDKNSNSFVLLVKNIFTNSLVIDYQFKNIFLN